MLARTLSLALVGLAAGLAPAYAQDKTLTIYNWTDYTAPEVVEAFEKETGIKVTIDTYDSNETLLARLKSGASGYDLIFPSADYIEILKQEGLIQKVDLKSLPNFKNLDTRYQSPPWDPNNEFVVVWHFGVTSFSVNTKQVSGPVDSLKTLFEPPAEAQGKLAMFNSASEVISLASIYLGIPQCSNETADLQRIQQLLLAQKPAVKVYSSDGTIERMSSGEVVMHQQWNGAAIRTRTNNPDVKYIFPKEGVTFWADYMAVPSTAKNVDNALAFVNFVLQPEMAAKRTSFAGYGSGVTGAEAFLPEELKTAPEMNIDPSVKLVPKPGCPAEVIRKQDQIFSRVRS